MNARRAWSIQNTILAFSAVAARGKRRVVPIQPVPGSPLRVATSGPHRKDKS